MGFNLVLFSVSFPIVAFLAPTKDHSVAGAFIRLFSNVKLFVGIRGVCEKSEIKPSTSVTR